MPEIDLILGGHDHIVFAKKINETIIMKSGCNFNNFHVVNLDFGKNLQIDENNCKKFEFNKFNLYAELVKVDTKFEEDSELKKYVDEYLQETEKQMEKVIIN